ncbi:hypothetical protein B0H19DRAFT_1253511 [Mycena capillaripes]|nr:hypothetical protein B0H19DRAFT_1253511 [Mycena capillaripes]
MRCGTPTRGGSPAVNTVCGPKQYRLDPRVRRGNAAIDGKRLRPPQHLTPTLGVSAEAAGSSIGKHPPSRNWRHPETHIFAAGRGPAGADGVRTLTAEKSISHGKPLSKITARTSQSGDAQTHYISPQSFRAQAVATTRTPLQARANHTRERAPRAR